jgi:serine/threonine protein kinase
MSAVVFEVGDIVDGRYQLLRDLGRGAAGRVFEARHLFTGRFVAVKIVQPQTRGANVPELRARLQREGQALASIHHPGVVDILDGSVTVDGTPYIVLEMLQGRTLEGIIATRQTLSPENAVGVALQLCDVLEAVHRAGVVHRDVKPANVLVVKDTSWQEVVRLVDFGVAKIVPESSEKLTGEGSIIGTPAYMAPEILLGEHEVDAMADLYGVGVTLFESLTGAIPYQGSYPQVVRSIASGQPAPSVGASAPSVPPGLVKVVDRAIAKNRAERYPTLKELARALEASIPGAGRKTSLLGPAGGPSEKQGADKRRAARAPYNTPVHIVSASGPGIDGRTEDISELGVFVLSFADCAAAQKVGLRFALPMEGKVVTVEAIVRWVRTSERPGSAGMRAMGLEFVSPPENARASIARYVSLMSGDGTARTR